MRLQAPIRHPLPYRLLIFDADGTLRGCTVAGRPPNTPEEVVRVPRVENVLNLYHWHAQHWFGIASNQGGVALGYLTERVCQDLLRTLAEQVTWSRWPTEVIRYCPHHPRAGCACRKPQSGLLDAIMAYWQHQGTITDHNDVLYVGDQQSDEDTATNARVDFCTAADFLGGTP